MGIWGKKVISNWRGKQSSSSSPLPFCACSHVEFVGLDGEGCGKIELIENLQLPTSAGMQVPQKRTRLRSV